LRIVSVNISAPYWPTYANFGMEIEESQADIGRLTKVAIFANSRWQRAAILKIALYPYVSQNYAISSKFGMPMQISIPRMAI